MGLILELLKMYNNPEGYLLEKSYQRGFEDAQRSRGKDMYYLTNSNITDYERESYMHGYNDGIIDKQSVRT